MNVLVTGGASGIGAAITQRLAANPSNNVVVTYCSSATAAAELARTFGNIQLAFCDFRERSSVDALVDRLDDWALGGLVNNALNGFVRAHFHKLPLAEFERSFQVNVLPVVAITQAVLARFRKARSGRIVTVLTSYIANVPPLGLSEYVANKAYLASLSKSWAAENAAFGITSNCVSPSMVRTRLVAELDAEALTREAEASPLRRLLTEDEVAEAVEFFLTASPHINGVNMLMNAATDVV